MSKTIDIIELFDKTNVISTIHDRIHNFVNSPKAQHAIHSTVHQALGLAKEHHRKMLASAVSAGLYHFAGVDYPADVDNALHSQVEHLADNLAVSKTMAHHMMKSAVGKLKTLHSTRGTKGTKEHDIGEHEDLKDELGDMLRKLSDCLDRIEDRCKKK